MASEKTYIYGKHAVKEALLMAPAAIRKIFLSPDMDDSYLRDLIKKKQIPMMALQRGKTVGDVSREASHQGVFAELSLGALMTPYDQFVQKLEVGPDTGLVLLGEVQDPHNVGAVIRSAAAFGIKGVLIPEHNQAPVTGAVVKVSAGMAFRVPLIAIGNVNNVVRDLKERGFWVYGLTGDQGSTPVTKEQFDRPALFILGNESKGIREKTRDLCDALVSIPMNPQCESLNAAAATAVTLFQWSTQHPKALK